MGMTLAEKLIAAHLVEGQMIAGQEIALRIDQTLTQDSTGTMAYLQFESMGVDRVKTLRSTAYVDHNMLQVGFENADDHKYIQTVAKKHGIYFSRPGNGICHQVNLERFGVPGQTLLGSDSHTPTAGGIGMLAMGAGGLDVAVAMGGGAYYITMPRIVNVRLHGRLQRGAAAKDVILEVLRRLSVKGGVGRIIEYSGDALETLSVPERATITNMGAELGATTSIFPSDAVTRAFLKAQGRQEDYTPLCADDDAVYEQVIDIELGDLAPMAACPHSPDAVCDVTQIAGKKVDQVCIGSCTNSSYLDLMRAARILKGRRVAENVSLVVAPGSRQVLSMLAKNGALADILASGARLLECACGPCIGMGQAPGTDAVSLRTFNRNFKGRSGTVSANVYLVSPETAAASAIAGVVTDPRTLDVEIDLDVAMPESFPADDSMVVPPAEDPSTVEVVRGPNIKPFPLNKKMEGDVCGDVLLKMTDNITTDHIMPSNAKLLPYRSNIPYLSDYCLTPVDPEFPARAKALGGGMLVAGENYGQGSSREHAALVPLYLGVRAVLAKSFARIHMANLINSGILPLVFDDPADYDAIAQGDALVIEDAPAQIAAGGAIVVTNRTNGHVIRTHLDASQRLCRILLAGGLIRFTRENA